MVTFEECILQFTLTDTENDVLSAEGSGEW